MSLSLSRMGQALSGLCLVALCLAQAAHAATLDIKHSSGTTTVPVNPQRVVVLDWSVLDTLSALDVEVAGIPTSNPPELLKQYRSDRFIKAGTLFEPDFEALKNAKPDLIILGRRSQAQYEEVSKFGTTIDLTPDPTDLLGSVVRNTQTLGRIFSREQQAKVLTDKLEASVQDLKTLSAEQGTGLVVLTTGGRMSAFGVGTRFGMLHDVFGVKPAVENLQVGRHGQSVSFEYLLEANPDWLFVMDRDAAIGREGVAAREMMDNELIEATTAGSRDQIVFLDPVSWYLLDNSGITVMQDSVDKLTQVFSAAQ